MENQSPCGVKAYQHGQLPAPIGFVLLEHHNAQRRFLARCDGRCHGTENLLNMNIESCGCLCEGKFHGIGAPQSEAWDRAILSHGPRLLKKWELLGFGVSGLRSELERLGTMKR